ncbi:MAG TPA: tripartite tricarboxylate transporter TctB family protein [Burkholderiaceae bacterium]|nr:tripartite tricarboxylate transporter TctB family protein [Burkholderiaceae bacterium]
MRIRNQRDFWSGLMFIAFGIAFMYWSQDYQMGTAAKMGPAYFPTVLGGLLVVLGLLVALPALRAAAQELKVERIDFMALFVVLFSVVLFALLLPYLGFVIAMVALIFASAFASHEFSFRDTSIAAVILVVGSWLVFVKGLELQFPVWPVFLTR